MKRLQIPRMVNGDDRNDMEDMENVEHQSGNEDHVLTTKENNPNRKAKDEKITYNFFSFVGRNAHMVHHISTPMPPTIQCIIEKTFMRIIT
jgi:hypothetical protein